MVIKATPTTLIAKNPSPVIQSGPASLAAQHSKKQIYPNSCGAASLLCVAKELGIHKLPVFSGSVSELIGIDTLEVDDRCETDIYAITSASSTYRHQQSDMTQAGYSMPDSIVMAGRLLGLHMSIEEDPGLFSKALTWIYPKTRQKMSDMGCPITIGCRKIESHQIKIEAMAASILGVPAGLHWVVHRNDGSYMDPATGKNHKNFDELNAGAKRDINQIVGYYKTGIAIIATGQLPAAR